MSVNTITPQQLDRLRQSGQTVELVDVRTPVEFAEVHVDFAHNIPLDQLDPIVWTQDSPRRNQPLFVICRSGSRGRQACERLLAAGVTQVVNVEGGTLAWIAAGLSVERGRKTISLERQVRIAAGALVLLGTGLGVAVHPLGFAVSALVGAGLIFAGVTDTCGMGLMLARMPWNRICPGEACETQARPPAARFAARFP